MQHVDTLLEARWVVPIIPRDTVFDHHTLVIHEGKILDLLPTSEAKNRYQADKVVELKDHVLLPGLVNAHTHSPMVLLRGLADDLALMDWLQNTIWPAENTHVNATFIEDGMRHAMAEMISSGTTCFNEHYFYPRKTAQVIADVGMRANVGLFVIDAKTPWCEDAAECFSKVEETLTKEPPSDRIQWTLAPHSPYMCGNETLLKIKELSDKNNLFIHMHVHEPPHEIEQSMKLYGKRPLQRLKDMGLLSPRLAAVHMTQTQPEDIPLLKENGVSVVHCPESNLKLASGFAPIQAFLEAGINLALGTDGAASNNDLDLFGEMHTAALIGKMVAQDPTATSALDVLEMATLGGAKALGLETKIGSLEPGKEADIIALNFKHLNTQPVYHPISHLVYACHSSQVTDVWVGGQQLLKNQELLTINRKDCLAAAHEWQERISSSTS